MSITLSAHTGQPTGQPSEQVDVIIAAWNRADTIERAIRSVMSEPQVHRVYVIDDASTDATAARARAIPAPPGRLEVLQLPRNSGPSAARNLALSRSRAPWIAILDGDDLMLPGRLGHLLAQSEGWDMVADDMLQVREGSPIEAGRRLLDVDASWPEQITLEQFVRGNMHDPSRIRREMGFLKPIIRRSFLEAQGLAYDTSLRLGEDYILYASALAAGAQFRITRSAGYVSMMRGDSLSARHSRADLEELLRCARSLSKRPGLTSIERKVLRQHADDVEKKVTWLATIDAVKARRPDTLLATLVRAPRSAPHVVKLLLHEAQHRLATATSTRLATR
jgi:succinoglycan biosynthesis protein ExoU